jgi:hypothetical protein
MTSQVIGMILIPAITVTEFVIEELSGVAEARF